MANIKKMTKADYFKQIMANYPLTDEEKAFCEHELELLAKKNSAEKKPTAQQVANAGICEAIYNGMEDVLSTPSPTSSSPFPSVPTSLISECPQSSAE